MILHSAQAGGKGLESSASTKGDYFWNERGSTVGNIEERITLFAWVTGVSM